MRSDLEGLFLVDMATSAAALGKIELAIARGEEVPKGWIIDVEWRPTTDPRDYRKGGTLLALGGSKGYKGTGLAAMVEVMCRLLTGPGFGDEPNRSHNDGCFLAAFNVAAFRPLDQFRKDVTEFVHYVKPTRSSEGSSGVFYPGEIGYLREKERRANGIEIEEATWQRLCALARDYGLARTLDLA